MIPEPVKLIGEGEYNINILTEMQVTESYLGLEQDVRECQNQEPFFNCTTKYHLQIIQKHCGCLPFNIRLEDKVS